MTSDLDHPRQRPRDPRFPGQSRRSRPRSFSRAGPSAGPSFPSGASTGTHEALELRDGDPARYLGKGVLKAVAHVNDVIGPRVKGMDVRDRAAIDRLMLELDGTPAKTKLGANAILSVSMAVADAAAKAAGLPLYASLRAAGTYTLPVPLINILNGGAHADNSVDIQEFMIAPAGCPTLRRGHPGRGRGLPQPEEDPEEEGLRHVGRRRGRIRPQPPLGRGGDRVHRREHPEGGLHPREARLPRPGRRRLGALRGRPVHLQEIRRPARGRRPEWSSSTPAWIGKYPIVSIEDGLAEDDWDGWKAMTEALGQEDPDRRRRPLRHEPGAVQAGRRRGDHELDPDQAEPDREPERDGRRRRLRPRPRLLRGHLPPFGRDRGHLHRRPERRPRHGPDQDRLGLPQRAGGQVQPAPRDRGRARGEGRLRRNESVREISLTGAVAGAADR